MTHKMSAWTWACVTNSTSSVSCSWWWLCYDFVETTVWACASITKLTSSVSCCSWLLYYKYIVLFNSKLTPCICQSWIFQQSVSVNQDICLFSHKISGRSYAVRGLSVLWYCWTRKLPYTFLERALKGQNQLGIVLAIGNPLVWSYFNFPERHGIV